MPQLEATPSTSTDGVIRLTWQHDGAVIVQQADARDFADAKIRYQGSDTASVLTGLPDGSYHFRVATSAGGKRVSAWSAPVEVRVAHHSLTRAFSYFTVGALVFLGTLGLIVLGARNVRQDG